jgi:high affinity sulfate transporter 1
MATEKTSKGGQIWGRFFPPLAWLREYKASHLPADMVAGVTLAAYAVPVSMAYAGLAGVPPVEGLYCYLFAGLAYFLLGTSRQLAIGPTSAISMLIGGGLATAAAGDPARLAALAAGTALLTAAICFVAWLFRLNQLVNFISETNLVGFKAGAALTIAVSQMPKVLGVPGGGEGFFERLWKIVSQVREANLWIVGVAVCALLLLWLGERFLPGRPTALAVVVLGIATAAFLPLSGHGVALTGQLPEGLPKVGMPDISFKDMDDLLELAFACFLLMFVESIAAARTFALKHNTALDPRQELLALGAANLASSVGHGFVVAGGLSQSAVNDKAGARSPLALPVASLALVCVLLFLTGPLALLPQAILGAIVLMAVKGLIDLKEIRHLWRVSRFDLYVAVVALVGVLTLGILKGVILAAIVSVLMLLRRGSHPYMAFLGRIPGTDRFSDMARHPENESVPGLLIFRVYANILYFNTEFIQEAVMQRMESEAGPVKSVVWDLSTSPNMDLPGARSVKALHEKLRVRGVALRLVEMTSFERDLLRGEGADQSLGEISRFATIQSAIDELSGGETQA